MERNDLFPILSNFARITGIVGWVLLVGGGAIAAISILIFLVSGPTLYKAGGIAVGVLIAGGGLVMIVLSELVGVFFSIEKNGAQLLQLERSNDRNRLITGESEAA